MLYIFIRKLCQVSFIRITFKLLIQDRATRNNQNELPHCVLIYTRNGVWIIFSLHNQRQECYIDANVLYRSRSRTTEKDFVFFFRSKFIDRFEYCVKKKREFVSLMRLI